VIPAGIEPAAYALGTQRDEDPDASARDVSSVSKDVNESEDDLALRFATSRGSSVAAAENAPLDDIVTALLRAQAAWLRTGDRRVLRRALLTLVASLDD
jgi:hypothetical protein